MSTIPTRTPQIPAIPKDVSHEVRRWMESVKEVIEVREGSRGQDLDRGVTFRDLVDANIDISNLNISGAPVNPPDGDGDGDGSGGDEGPNVPPWTPRPGDIDPLPYLPTPPEPTGLSASGGVGIVWVAWSNPQTIYRNHRLTEIWRARREYGQPAPTLDDAEQIGTASAGRFVDHVESEGTDLYYYWIRFLSTEDIYGPWAGPVSASNIYLVLRDQITNDFLDSFLSQEIDLISAAKGVPGSVNNRISVEAGNTQAAAVEEVRVAYIGDTSKSVTEFVRAVFGPDYLVRPEHGVTLSAKVDRVKSTADGNSTSVTALSGSIDGIKGVWGVKIDTTTRGGKHYMSGFGLIQNLEKDEHGNYTGHVESAFTVDVNTFSVIDSSKYQDSHDPVDIQTPFMIGDVDTVDDYGNPITKKMVVIKDTAIGNATITSAKIASLEADKIDSGHINANTSITLGGDVNDPNKHRYMEINSFVDSNGNNNAHMVFYDNNGKPRVQVGRSTGSHYGYEGFGLQVWDEYGNPVFDANGSRLRVTDAFIDDLWIGGFKATVPDGSCVTARINIDTRHNAQTKIAEMSYLSKGIQRVCFQIGFEYTFWSRFEIDSHNTAEYLTYYLGLYAPWSSNPVYGVQLYKIRLRYYDCDGPIEECPGIIPTGKQSFFYLAPIINVPEDYRNNVNLHFEARIGVVLTGTSHSTLLPWDGTHEVSNRTLLVNGLR